MLAIAQGILLFLGTLSLAVLSLSATRVQRKRFPVLRRLDGRKLHAFLAGACALLLGLGVGVVKDALTPTPLYTIVSSLSQQSYPQPGQDAFERELQGALSEIGTAARDSYAAGWTALEKEEFSQAEAHFEKSLRQVPTLAALLGYAGTLVNLSKFTEAQEAYRRGLALAKKQRSSEYQEAFYAGLGHSADSLGNTEEAIRFYGIAMQLARSAGDRGREADLLAELACAEANRNTDRDRKRALDRLDQALAIFRKLGDRRGEARVLNNIACVREQPGDVQSLHRALNIYERANSRSGQADVKGNLGTALLAEHQYDLSLQYQEEALTLHRELGDRVGEANDIHNIGLIYLRVERFTEAIAKFEQSLVLHQDVGSRVNAAKDLYCLGEAYSGLHDFAMAESKFRESHTLATAAGDRGSEPILLLNLANIYTNTNRPALALAAAQRAVELQRTQGSRTEYAQALSTRGDMFALEGCKAAALRDYDDAVRAVRAGGDRRAEHALVADIGKMLWHIKDLELALARYREAYALADSLADWVLKVEDIQRVARLLQSLKRNEESLTAWRTGYLLCAGASDDEGSAFFLKQLGQLQFFMHLNTEATQSFEMAMGLYKRRGELGQVAGILSDWGDYLSSTRSGDALRKYQQALDLARRIPDPAGEARMLYAIGMTHDRMEDFALADDAFRQSYSIATRVRAEATAALALNSLAYSDKKRGDIAAGIEKLNTALMHCRATGDRNLTSGMCRMISESLQEFHSRADASQTKTPRVAAAR